MSKVEEKEKKSPPSHSGEKIPTWAYTKVAQQAKERRAHFKAQYVRNTPQT